MSITPDEAIIALGPWINKHKRPAWRPRVCADDPARSASAFSGIPMLLPGEDWPLCQCCHAATELIVQLDLETLPRDGHGPGILQLFYCVAGDACEGGWEPFSNCVSLCRVVLPSECQLAATNLNSFPAKAIEGWDEIEDLPNGAEHDRLGIKFDYHFDDVPFQPMELWCPELDLHFVGAEFLEILEESVASAGGDKFGGWPNWVQDVEYPACPECGAEMSLVMQIDSEDHVPYMFGDCGVGHITQCPQHLDVVAFGWACS